MKLIRTTCLLVLFMVAILTACAAPTSGPLAPVPASAQATPTTQQAATLAPTEAPTLEPTALPTATSVPGTATPTTIPPTATPTLTPTATPAEYYKLGQTSINMGGDYANYQLVVITTMASQIKNGQHLAVPATLENGKDGVWCKSVVMRDCGIQLMLWQFAKVAGAKDVTVDFQINSRAAITNPYDHEVKLPFSVVPFVDSLREANLDTLHKQFGNQFQPNTYAVDYKNGLTTPADAPKATSYLTLSVMLASAIDNQQGVLTIDDESMSFGKDCYDHLVTNTGDFQVGDLANADKNLTGVNTTVGKKGCDNFTFTGLAFWPIPRPQADGKDPVTPITGFITLPANTTVVVQIGRADK